MERDMEYLFKVYYKNGEHYLDTYKKRFEFETTLKTGLMIKPYRKTEQFQLYYMYNNDTARFLEMIRKNDTTLQSLEDALPEIAKRAFLVDVISEELKNSNDLEGVETNKYQIAETTRHMLENASESNSRLGSMINSYMLLRGAGNLKLPSDVEDIRKIYDKITDGEIRKNCLPDGTVFRKDAVFVQKKGTVSNEILHRGVMGEENIIVYMNNLLNFLRNETISLLLRVAIGHYYFGYIHPFYDGNGRVGRFLSSLYIKQEYHYFTAMSLSRGCMLSSAQYYNAFRDTNAIYNRGEMNGFVDSFLEILLKGQEDIIQNLLEKKNKLNTADEFIKRDERLDSLLKKALMFMFAQDYYFGGNAGIERKMIIEIAKRDNYPELKVKKVLSELNQQGLLNTVSKRPLIYRVEYQYLDGSYMEIE